MKHKKIGLLAAIIIFSGVLIRNVQTGDNEDKEVKVNINKEEKNTSNDSLLELGFGKERSERSEKGKEEGRTEEEQQHEKSKKKKSQKKDAKANKEE